MSVPILKRILLVEDDPDIQEVAALALTSLGRFVVETCSSGPEAIAAVPNFRPQLILLDVMMPGMDGLRTLEALRALPETADAPVVFLTAKAQREEIEKYKRAGAADVLVKPFEPARLPERLEHIWRCFHDQSE
ncbi:MAG TPA: response regulator [Vicinamibacteria bacterium]|nr:response regulator [Vicinamibacteria bacterium]